MGQREAYCDPFGAPEFLVDGVVYREMVGSEMVRFGFFNYENGGRILRVRIVLPVRQLVTEQQITSRFLGERTSDPLARCH